MTSDWIRSNISPFHQYVNPSLTTRTTSPSPDLPLGSVRVSPIPDLRTNQAVSSLEAFDSPHNASEELDRIIIQNKKDAWKNQEVSDILDDFFGNSSLLTLQFCSNMISSSRCAGRFQTYVKSALDSFQEQHYALSGEDRSNLENFSNYFQDNIWTAAHPFPVEHFQAFNRVFSKQLAMIERLEAKRMKLERALKELTLWRKVFITIFVIAFGLTLVGSVASVYAKASAGFTALIAAVMLPLGWLGKWLNSTWKTCEVNFWEQREIISAMKIASAAIFHELVCTAALLERLQIETEELLTYTNLTTWEDEAGLVSSMAEIKNKVDDIVKTVRDLSVPANKCIQKTKLAKEFILSRMNHPAGGSNNDISIFP